MNPYFTDPGMLDRIVDAAGRGVDVRLLVSERSNNAPADAALTPDDLVDHLLLGGQ